jgi:predicted transcriptional regulator
MSSKKEKLDNICRISPLGTEIILSLKEEAQRLSDLRTSINARDTSILHKIKNLEAEKLIIRDSIKHSYSLTNKGYIYAVLFNKLFTTSNTLREMDDFWLQHDISGIPEHLLVDIGALNKATIFRFPPDNLDAVHNKYLDMLTGSKRIDGVSPVFHPDFADTFAEKLGQGARVRLVITDEVLDKIRESVKIKDLVKHVKKIFIDRNLEIYLRNNLKVALTVSEKFLSLGLFTLNGAYDYSVDVIGTDPQILSWGKDLFDYYRRNSKKIKFSSLLS